MDERGGRRYRAGEPVTDLCRACKVERAHTAIAVDSDGRVLRVMCDFCGSLTSFNVLFADATDQFRGAGGGESG